MKGRRPPPRPEIATLVSKAEPLTVADVEAALDLHAAWQHMPPLHLSVSEYMRESTPYERGVLERYQDKKASRHV